MSSLTCGRRVPIIDPEDKGESQIQMSSPDLPPLTTTTERKLMAKVDWHVVPCLCVMYLLAFLDRYASSILSAILRASSDFAQCQYQ